MADREYWIQLENRPWDASPNNIDRMHGHDIEHTLGAQGAPPVIVTITSPETLATRQVRMYLPVNAGIQTGAGGVREWRVIDTLILRRYTDNWQTPDDRKVNPWDLNEPNPTDTGTMGTIPGPTLECNVGDRIIVHFRNKDFRANTDVTARTHSLHPHGIVFPPQYDGAFPLSPPDPTQPIPPAEAAAWSAIGVTGGLKQGDRVPPGGTFTYIWDTFGWPATAGVWHYHDHSICDATNVMLGAVGFLIIHNPADPDEVIEQDLPQGQPNGRLIRLRCFRLPIDLPLLPHQLERLRRVRSEEGGFKLVPATEDAEATSALLQGNANQTQMRGREEHEEPDHDIQSAFALEAGPFAFEISRDLRNILSFCLPRYIDPPERIQILQYYHELPGVHMTINGRRFLGNTPTVIAGPRSKMRFGLAAMNNLTFHTFHLHGHRWVIPGPAGTDPNIIQNSPQTQAVSQFEDTRMFGPANSFSFTINQGSFMGSRFTPDPSRAPGLGEWHMHCHVLSHMMPGGMMGSLLVIQGGELALGLAQGIPCELGEAIGGGHLPDGDEGGGGMLHTVNMQANLYVPPHATITVGDQVQFVNLDPFSHTVDWDGPGAPPNSGTINPQGSPEDSYTTPPMHTVGTFNFHCAFHGFPGGGMHGSITVTNP